MPDIALDQLEAANITPDAKAPVEMAVSDIDAYGSSSTMYYQPTRTSTIVDGEQKSSNPFMSFIKGVPLGMESMPGKLGKALVMFGDHVAHETKVDFSKFFTGRVVDTVETENLGRRKFADRMVMAGTIMQERNAAWLQERHPDINQKNFWRDVGAGVPTLAGIIGVTLLTKKPEIGVALGTAQGGTDAYLESYWRGREGNLDYKKNMEIANLMGLTMGSLSAYGLDRFLHVSGPVISQIVKGAVIQGASAASQSIAADVIQTAGGIVPFKGKESLLEIMENAAYNGAIMFVLGGATAAPLAHSHRATVREGFEKMGVPPEKAKGLADEVMKDGMHSVLKLVEKDVNPTQNELARFINPTVEAIKNGEVVLGKDVNGPLSRDFIPQEPRELVNANLEERIAFLEKNQLQMKSINESLKENRRQQELQKDPVELYRLAIKEGKDAAQGELKNIEKSYQQNLKETKIFYDRQEAVLRKEQSSLQEQLKKTKSDLDEVLKKLDQENVAKDPNFKETSTSKTFDSLKEKEKTLRTRQGDLEKSLQDNKSKMESNQNEAEQTRRGLIETQKKALEKHQKNLVKTMDKINENFKEGLSAEGVLRELKANEQKLLQQQEVLKSQNVAPKSTLLNELRRTIRDLKKGFREGKITTKLEVKDVQKHIIDLLKDSNLDAADKGKFLATIKNIQTFDQLNNKLPEIEIRIKTLQDKAIVREAVDTISKINLKGLPVEYQDAIGMIKSQFNLKRESANRVIERKATAEFFRRQLEENGKLAPEESRILADAERMSISEMTAEQVESLKNLVLQLANNGRLKNKLLTIKEARDFNSFVDESSSNILDGKTLERLSTFQEALIAQNPDIKSWTAEKFQSYMAVQLRPELMFDMMKMRPVYESMVAADTAKQNSLQANLQRMRARYLKVDLVKAMTDRVNIGRFEKMPIDTAMFVYANSLNEKNAMHLEGSGLSATDVADITTWLKENLPEAVKAIDDQIKYYDQVQYGRLDEIHSELKGFHLPKEENYFPIQKLEGVAEKSEAERGILERALFASATPKNAFTKGRVISDAAFKEFSYFNTVYRNMADVEHYIAFAKTLNDVNKLWNDPTIKDSVEQRFGETFWNSIDSMIKDVAYNGTDTYQKSFEKVFDFIRTNYVTAALGWNLMTVAKQPAAWFAGAQYVGKKWVTKATVKYITDPMKWTKFVNENSVLMKNRPMTQERELVDLMRKKGIYQIQPFRIRDKVVQNSLAMMQIADKATADSIWLGAYDKSISEGMGHQESILEADRAIRRTQSMGGDLYLPMLFRGSALTKMFTLFQNQANQNLNLLYESVGNLTKGGVTPSKVGRFSSEFAMYSIAPALLIGLISRMRPPEEDEFMWDVVNQSVGGLFGVGFLTQALSTQFMGNLTPIDATVNSLYMFLQGKEDETKLKAALDLAGDVTGISFRNIRRIADGSMFQTPEDRRSGGGGKSKAFGNPGRTGR